MSLFKNGVPYKTITGSIVLFFSVIALFLSVYTVPTGSVAIVLAFGKVIEVTLPGLHFKVPYRDTTDIMNTQVLGNVVTFDAVTSDQQRVRSVIAIQWSVAGEGNPVEERIKEATGLYTIYGSRAKFDKAILDTRTETLTKAVTGTYKLEQIVQKRQQVQDDIVKQLTAELADYPITVEGIQVIDISPSTEYRNAIERKQVAEVDAISAKETAKKIEAIAEANKNKAVFEAEASAAKIRLDREAQASGILAEKTAEAEGLAKINTALAEGGSDLIEYTKWSRWSGVTPQTVVSGSNPGVEFGIGSSIGQQAVNK